MEGHIIAKVEESGELRYNKYQNTEEELNELMNKLLTKNSSQRPVGSREKGVSRREQQVTTSSHNEKTKEERRRIKVTLRNKDKGRRYLKREGEAKSSSSSVEKADVERDYEQSRGRSHRIRSEERKQVMRRR